MRSRAQLLALVAILALFVGAVPAARGAEESENDAAWHFDAAPYFWMPEIVGRVTTGGARGRSLSASLHLGIDDSLKLFTKGRLWAGMGHFEVRKRRLSLFLDVVGMHAEDGQTVIGRTLGPGIVARPQRTTKIDVFTDLVTTEFGATYRVLDWPRVAPGTPAVSVEALAGGRYLHSANEIDLRSSTRFGPVGAGASADSDVVDPFFGGRWAIGFRDDLVLTFRGDVGGFDTGTHFTWQLASALRYRLPWTLLSVPLWAGAGYRVLDFAIDERTNCSIDKKISLQLRGPFLGLQAQF